MPTRAPEHARDLGMRHSVEIVVDGDLGELERQTYQLLPQDGLALRIGPRRRGSRRRALVEQAPSRPLVPQSIEAAVRRDAVEPGRHAAMPREVLRTVEKRKK